ncbi:MAG: hypothetical protein HY842_09125 [Bacteroidetes bacterium]|nr:hypothetical protein [Bacteroidota bacterium]
MGKFSKTERLLMMGLCVFIAISYALVLPDLRNHWRLTYEDGIVETTGALAFLLASMLFTACFFLSKKSGVHYRLIFRERNVHFLLLGILFFIAFGEEISWGQRLFGWHTPEELASHNLQGETNLHNLDIFVYRSEEPENKYGFFSNFLVFSAGRLFFYFWFSFFVVIPLLHRFSAKWKGWFRAIHLPIAPLWAGTMMLANLAIAKSVDFFVRQEYTDHYATLDEFSETNYAVIVVGLAVYWWWEKSGLGSKVFPAATPKKI